jgi:hypothetical protein
VRIDSSKLEQLVRLLAARTSGMVNYAALGRELALDDKTVKAHAELLAQLFLVYRLSGCGDDVKLPPSLAARASACILIVYMAASTTIRVSAHTRDLLKALSARQRRSTGEIVSELVQSADDELLLADAQSAFRRLAKDPALLAAYRSEAEGIGDAFDAPAPGW